jgi:hypothetical protein
MRRILRLNEGKDAMHNWGEAMAILDKSIVLALEIDNLKKNLGETNQLLIQREAELAEASNGGIPTAAGSARASQLGRGVDSHGGEAQE